jgi:gas vesicle protein
MTKSTKIALGLLGAAAAGLVVGLLIAPEKGKDIRKKIKDKTGDLTDQLGDLIAKSENNIKAKVESTISKLKESVN